MLTIKGGRNYDIARNTVRHKASGYYGAANLALNNYYMHLPAQFFTTLHAPLMRLSLPDSANVTISENDFRGIRSMQPLFDNQHYLASLIQFD